jgi:hypothetical protein
VQHVQITSAVQFIEHHMPFDETVERWGLADGLARTV